MMTKPDRKIIEMTIEGDIVDAAGRAGPPSWLIRLAVIATLVGVVALMLGLTVLSLYLVITLLPALLIAGGLLYLAARWQSWRRR